MAQPRIILALVLAFVAGAASAMLGTARAEQAAFDRAIVERLVRAEEQQVHALEALTRATERCKH